MPATNRRIEDKRKVSQCANQIDTSTSEVDWYVNHGTNGGMGWQVSMGNQVTAEGGWVSTGMFELTGSQNYRGVSEKER